ncbi:MAG: DUF302 domain-containing protein [bacterium]|nr:DUF302 domain-containing protein [bacterium]
MSEDGLIRIKSNQSVEQTADRLEAALQAKEMKIFGRVPHSAGAAKAGLELKPTLLILFGNPKAGTPLMQESRTVAIDLPQKMLIWEDDAGAVWLAYNDPAYLARRHGLKNEAVLSKIAGALEAFARAATE